MLPPFAAAETVTVVDCVTGAVVRVNVPLALPAGTMKFCGIEATADAPAVTVRVTVVSLATGIAKLTFPTEFLPPFIGVGVKKNPVGVFGLTVRVAVFVPPFAVALI